MIVILLIISDGKLANPNLRAFFEGFHFKKERKIGLRSFFLNFMLKRERKLNLRSLFHELSLFKERKPPKEIFFKLTKKAEPAYTLTRPIIELFLFIRWESLFK